MFFACKSDPSRRKSFLGGKAFLQPNEDVTTTIVRILVSRCRVASDEFDANRPLHHFLELSPHLGSELSGVDGDAYVISSLLTHCCAHCTNALILIMTLFCG